MPAIRHHEAQFPLVVVEWEGEATDAELREHLARLDAYGQHAQKRLLLYDVRPGTRVGHGQRQQFASWLRRNARLVATMNVAVLFVTDSPVARIILRAILFAQPLGCPTRTFPRLDEALRHAADLFEAEGNHLLALRLRRSASLKGSELPPSLD